MTKYLHTHNNEKPFKSGLFKILHSESTLTLHLYIHTSEKQFRSNGCPKSLIFLIKKADWTFLHTLWQEDFQIWCLFRHSFINAQWLKLHVLILTLSTLCPYPLQARRYGRLNEARISYVHTFLMLMFERKCINYVLRSIWRHI